jgi:hypothetical protein
MSRLASRLPAWPFVLLVLAIALLSLLAPSTWRGRFSEPVDMPPARDASRGPDSVYAHDAEAARRERPENSDLAASQTELSATGPLSFVATPVPDPDYSQANSGEVPTSAPIAAMPLVEDEGSQSSEPAGMDPTALASPTSETPAAQSPATESPSTESPVNEVPANDAPATTPLASPQSPSPSIVNEPMRSDPVPSELVSGEPIPSEPVSPTLVPSNPAQSTPTVSMPERATADSTLPERPQTAPTLEAPVAVLDNVEPTPQSTTKDRNNLAPSVSEPKQEKLAEVIDETGSLTPTAPGLSGSTPSGSAADGDLSSRPMSSRPMPVGPMPDGPGENAAPAALVTALPTPTVLLEELKAFAEQGILVDWADAVRVRLERLSKLPRLEDPVAPRLLQELGELADQAGPLSSPLGESPERVRILRAAYGVSRRVAVWDALCRLSATDRSGNDWSLTTTRQLEAAQLAVEVHLARSQYRDLWRNYLCLDRAKELVGVMDEPTTRQRDIARVVLTRLDVDALNESQTQFLSHPVFINYRAALRAYSRQDVGLSDMVQLIERYETTLASLDARRVAHGFQTLRWSPLESETQAAQPINDHYRNANVRVAISAALINRILPTEHTSLDPVDDVIHSARVQGTSRTSSRLKVFLVPSRLQWRLGLEARGDVESQTESRKGPATFYQDAMANFDARKHVTVDKRGIRTDRAEARAKSSSDLRGLETDFDDIPLFNRLARGIANRQYHEQSSIAAAEVEARVANLASQRLDQEVQNRLSDAEGEFQTRWLMPLRNMGLDPTPVDFETTDQRLIVRYRIAAIHQLAAHTPRPQAPTNSWMSVQLHESAINNTLDQLGIGGRKLTVQELCDELSKKFGRPSPPLPEDVPEDMTVTLAQRDGIRVRCDGGKLRLTLRVAELSQNRHSKWKNFMVQTTYVPSPDQRNANLVRDGIIELSSEGRGVGNQFALRTIFSKVLSKNRTISLINHSMAQQPEFADLMINQFVLSDGWIGIAMAPKPNTARIPYRRSIH